MKQFLQDSIAKIRERSYTTIEGVISGYHDHFVKNGKLTKLYLIVDRDNDLTYHYFGVYLDDKFADMKKGDLVRVTYSKKLFFRHVWSARRIFDYMTVIDRVILKKDTELKNKKEDIIMSEKVLSVAKQNAKVLEVYNGIIERLNVRKVPRITDKSGLAIEQTVAMFQTDEELMESFGFTEESYDEIKDRITGIILKNLKE